MNFSRILKYAFPTSLNYFMTSFQYMTCAGQTAKKNKFLAIAQHFEANTYFRIILKSDQHRHRIKVINLATINIFLSIQINFSKALVF